MTAKDLHLMIEDQEYPVLDTTPASFELDHRRIHAISVGWDAPFISARRRVALRAAGVVHPIRVLSTRFHGGAQRLSFLLD